MKDKCKRLLSKPRKRGVRDALLGACLDTYRDSLQSRLYIRGVMQVIKQVAEWQRIQ